MNMIETKVSLENWMDMIEDFCFDLESCIFDRWTYAEQLHEYSNGTIPLWACEEIEDFDTEHDRNNEEDYRNGDKIKDYDYNAQLELIKRLYAEAIL